jgi:hypothetical protein
MDLLGLLSAIWRRKLLAVLMIAVAAFAAITTAYKVPSMKPRELAVGAATSQILVDSNPSTLVAGAGTDQIAALGSRARVYAQYLSSRDAVDQIARASGIPARLITARGPFSQGTGIKNYEQQPAESRAKDLVDESKTYRLVYEAQEDVPIISVYATGPDAGSALKLAQSSFTVLRAYVATLDTEGEAARAKQAEQDKALAKEDPNAAAQTTAQQQANDISVVVRELGTQDLDGDGAIEHDVAALPHLAHPAEREPAQQQVPLVEARLGGDGHGLTTASITLRAIGAATRPPDAASP